MAIGSTLILCDGCGLPASPEHIAERLGRLELATRFRPIHVHELFVALAPMYGFETDFYRVPIAKDIFYSVMDVAEIIAGPEKSVPESNPNTDADARDAAMLAEFQHKGYYLAYLSECPIRADSESADAAIARLGENLVRRIRFNYRPGRIALLGSKLAPLIAVLGEAGLGSLLRLDHGRPWAIPETSDLSAGSGLRAASPTN